MKDQFVDIVFDGPPSNESGRFVEVENAGGHSVNLGTWLERTPGVWVLRVTPEDLERVLYVMPSVPGWYLDRNGDPIRVDGDRYSRPGHQAYNDFHYRKFAPFRRLVVAEEETE